MAHTSSCLSVARKSHLYHCIWHFPFASLPAFPFSRPFLPPNKPEGSKFLNAASQAQIQRFRIAPGHEAVMLTAVFQPLTYSLPPLISTQHVFHLAFPAQSRQFITLHARIAPLPANEPNSGSPKSEIGH